MKHIKLFEQFNNEYYSSSSMKYLKDENKPDTSSLTGIELRHASLSIDDDFEGTRNFNQVVGKILLDAYNNQGQYDQYFSILENDDFFLDKQIEYLEHNGYIYYITEDDEGNPETIEIPDIKGSFKEQLSEVTDFTYIEELVDCEGKKPSLEQFFWYVAETMFPDYDDYFFSVITDVTDRDILTVWRQIRVNKKFVRSISKNTTFENISFGKYWSFVDLEGDSGWSPDTDGVPLRITIEARVHTSSINWFDTVLQNFSMPEECCISLIPNSNIIIDSIKIEDEIEIDLEDYSSLNAKV